MNAPRIPHGTASVATLALGWFAVCVATAGCSTESEDPAPPAHDLAPRIRFEIDTAPPPLPVSAAGTPEAYRAAAAAAPSDEQGAPGPVVIDRDRRIALQAPLDHPVRLAPITERDAAPGDAVRVAFDAVAVRRDASKGAARLIARDGDTVLDTFEIPAAYATFSIAAEHGLRALTLTREDDLGSDTIILLANPRIVSPVLPGRPGQPQPTVLLITSDTHRADHVSSINPRSPVATPHIDALGGEGALFTNCFASINSTNPSHVALMTGVHPRDTKIIDNRTRMHTAALSLAEQFRAAGYQTHAVTSAFHLFDDVSGLGDGFDRMSAPERGARDGKETIAIAERWIADAEGAPLFMWLHLFDVHTPYELPEAETARLLERYPDPRRSDADLGLTAEQIPGWLKTTGLRDADYVNALYAGEVAYLDGFLGPFLDHPRLADATIAFTADHGEALGEGEVWWDHAGLRDATIHIPLTLRGPGVESGLRSAAPVRQIDIGRTLLNMSDLEETEFPGRDLREALGETPPLEPRFALATHAASASIELDGWLLELFLRDTDFDTTDRTRALGRCELFHLPTDPKGERDRLLDEFERARRMRDALVKWLGQAEVTGISVVNHDVPPEVTAKLAELGYSGGYESVFHWWAPEARDPDWASNPWNVAFEGDGDVRIAARAIEAAQAR